MFRKTQKFQDFFKDDIYNKKIDEVPGVGIWNSACLMNEGIGNVRDLVYIYLNACEGEKERFKNYLRIIGIRNNAHLSAIYCSINEYVIEHRKNQKT